MAKIRLANEELWKEFSKKTTEMIVTKSGRKMFPKLEYSLSGLNPDAQYAISLEIEQVDDNRYKFASGEWSPAGRGELAITGRRVHHHDGAMPGKQWMQTTVQFERVKITNNPNDANQSHIFLHSMHKYIPVVTLYELEVNAAPFIMAPGGGCKAVCQLRLPCTEFIAVTAYQNENVKKLKIEHNPFAKGFREGGGDRKRSLNYMDLPSPKRSPPSLPLTPTPALGLIHNTTLPFLNTAGLASPSPLWYPQAMPYWNPYFLMQAAAQVRSQFQSAPMAKFDQP